MKRFKNLQLNFKVTDNEIQFKAECGEKTAIICELRDGILYINTLYSFKENPITVTGKAQCGDEAILKIFDFKIELYINGELVDEEWPCGSNFLGGAKYSIKNTEIEFSEAELPKKDEPSVLYTFQNAEGWKPEGDIFVGDCMPYFDDGRYHVIYLYDRHHHGSKWGLGAHQWAHISTEDFVTWQAHPMMVDISEHWEGSICTGSHIKKGDVHYLYYTVRMYDLSPAPIRRSISYDGYHYEKDTDFGFCLSYDYDTRSARDPKVIQTDDGVYHMFITTTSAKLGKGCLAHLTSLDLDNWKEEDDPIYVSPDENQPECPDYFKAGDYHYLVFSHRGQGQYLYSKKPLSDWQKPDLATIPCKSVPKSALFKDKIVFTGFNGNGYYAGTMTFRTAHVGEDGQLVFE